MARTKKTEKETKKVYVQTVKVSKDGKKVEMIKGYKEIKQ